MFTFIAQFKRDQKIIIFSNHCLASWVLQESLNPDYR